MKDYRDFMCDVEIDELSIEPAALPRRVFEDRMNPFDMRPHEFRVTLGMSKEFFKDLLDMLTPQLIRKRQNDCGNLLPIHRLTIFLQFLRTNGFHKSVGSQFFIRVTQSMVTTTVNSLSRVVASLKSEYVQFPDMEEGKKISQAIFEDTGFPGV